MLCIVPILLHFTRNSFKVLPALSLTTYTFHFLSHTILPTTLFSPFVYRYSPLYYIGIYFTKLILHTHHTTKGMSYLPTEEIPYPPPCTLQSNFQSSHQQYQAIFSIYIHTSNWNYLWFTQGILRYVYMEESSEWVLTPSTTLWRVSV